MSSSKSALTLSEAPILIGPTKPSVFFVYVLSETDGETFATITVLDSLLDRNSKESLRIVVNLDDLYGI